jgi:hypothetical protein
LLGTYAAPASAVDIQPTGTVGWDGHPVWEYVVDLDETLLEHAIDPATRESFNETENTEYWISIAAEDGHVIDVDSGTTHDNGDPLRTAPWWGWHTTPDAVDHPIFNDDAPFAANVSMDGDQWVYAPWTIAPQLHDDPDGFNNLAFELLTADPNLIGLDGIVSSTMSFAADTDTVVVPEPSSFALLTGAVVVAFGRLKHTSSRRRHSRYAT